MTDQVRPWCVNECCLEGLSLTTSTASEGEEFVCPACGETTQFVDGAWGWPDPTPGAGWSGDGLIPGFLDDITGT